LLGFLFGIPRVLQKDSQSEAAESKSGIVPRSAGYQLIINTNLDDVSDWLTKILLGVGLVELQKLPSLVYRLAWMGRWQRRSWTRRTSYHGRPAVLRNYRFHDWLFRNSALYSTCISNCRLRGRGDNTDRSGYESEYRATE